MGGVMHRERKGLRGFLQEEKFQRRQGRVGAAEWMRRRTLCRRLERTMRDRPMGEESTGPPLD